VMECSGSRQAINAGIKALRRQGRMGVIGIPGPEELNINWKEAVLKAINVVFSFASSPLSWNMVLSMLGRKVLDVESLISHREPLENWQKVFEEIEKGNVVKAILYP
jgi:L-iditol 2-dehydrogenase